MSLRRLRSCHRFRHCYPANYFPVSAGHDGTKSLPENRTRALGNHSGSECEGNHRSDRVKPRAVVGCVERMGRAPEAWWVGGDGRGSGVLRGGVDRLHGVGFIIFAPGRVAMVQGCGAVRVSVTA